MNAQLKKKISRLNRKKIWPSIISFIFTGIFITIICSVIASIFVYYTISNKTSEALSDTQKIVDYVKENYKDGDYKKALDDIKSNGLYDNDILFYDTNHNKLAGSTDVEIDLDSYYFIDFDLDTKYYVTSASSVLFKMEDHNVDINSRMIIKILFTSAKVDLSFDAWYRYDIGASDCMFVSHCIIIGSREIQYAKVIFYFILGIVSIMTIIAIINICKTITSQRRTVKLFYTDTVTGGNNWAYFVSTAQKKLKKRKAPKYAVVEFRLRKYRSYAACHGVIEAEQVLERIDRILNSFIYKGEMVAHNDAADFGMFLKCENVDEVRARVCQMIPTLMNVGGNHRFVYHIGIFFDENEKDINNMCSYATAAVGSVSSINETQIAIFNEALLKEQLWEHKVEENMEAAIACEEFKVYLQPKYNPVTEELAGAEALVRWISPTEGFIAPNRFIPIFEENGFITKLDDYMISHVAALQSGWLAQGKKIVPVSVNVSRAHFQHDDLAEHICALVDEYNTPHEYIELELTESAFFDDKNMIITTVNKLKEYGFAVSMDDFGSGYSSLNSLKELPLDVLKLDAEFFRGEDKEDRGDIVVSEAIQLGKKLNMKIVAEGIEKKEQVEFLAEQGCDMIQGYYFAKPMPALEYEERL